MADIATRVDQVTRRQAWTLLQDVVRLSRYYKHLVVSMARRHRMLLLVQAIIAVSGGILLTLSDLVGEIVVTRQGLETLPWSIASFLVAAISVWILMHNFSDKLATARIIIEQCDAVAIKVRKLWLDIEAGTVDSTEARLRWLQLEEDLQRATSAATRMDIRTRTRINNKAEAEAVKIVNEEYA